ncbi:FAD-dependent oxidoreductase [Ehrlichia chaffeensis]|uniref:FAD-dependent oxidoreductase n=1 Tax=Ehrlichia chaffeensis TaxID=945 RepID=UPI000444E0F1|nr:FAD-dependent oxidoreductase [Ehrlichia chaffeensis]AHX09632.1 pyridine nucleotide-disulfide oxidoreductase family protein [Ehrlichia chaffeensis str. Wakulla]
MLDFELTVQNLYTREGLVKLDNLFLSYLQSNNQDLYEILIKERQNNTKADNTPYIIELSYILEHFITQLFKIEDEIIIQRNKHKEFSEIYKCKRLFIQRYALKKYPDINSLNISETIQQISQLFQLPIQEKKFAQQVLLWFEDQEKYSENLDITAKYAAYMVHSKSNSILFNIPNKIDFSNLVHTTTTTINNDTTAMMSEHIKRRDGFNLTHTQPTLYQALNNCHYCIFCHKQNKDSCSKGLLENNNTFKKSILSTELHGCPLEEKISEMNLVKSQGYTIAALAIAMIDNPLCVLTGYHICNDCTKSCIYQKQDPVNIPMVETQIVNNVLALSYGFEIYSLLTRWNPINFERHLPQISTNKNVLVIGLGPAGINLSHHLLNDGHTVVAIDGLKIEPLPQHISGVTQFGEKTEFKLIKNVETELYENLSERIPHGFGGVSEYGITARWDKNYLKIARLILERRKNFAMYGGIRFGSTLTIENAFEMGFHHIAIATGSGSPNMINVHNSLVRGVRMASDFLMSLQLTGAARTNSIANLQIRLPIIIIGGGLTAIDTATEALAYYPLQVEKFLTRYETLIQIYGKSYIEKNWTEEEKLIANEFLNHAIQIREEKILAKTENREAKIIELLQLWGGVTIVYRNKLSDAPSYKLNSDEINNALAEGIYFIENLQPYEINTDQYNHVSNITLIDQYNNKKTLFTKTIIIAAGTKPNLVSIKENQQFRVLGQDFTHTFDLQGNNIEITTSPKPTKKDSIFISPDKKISIFGDLHLPYRGSVVKAMASAKNGYPIITQALKQCLPIKDNLSLTKLNHKLIAHIVDIKHITKTITKLTISAPLAAANFKPGQFYRLQNFECNSLNIENTQFAIESLALTGVSVDKNKGLISTIVLNTGGSSHLCNYLKKNEPIIFMGPTGAPTEIPHNQNIILIGGGVGNAVLFSIGKALLSNNCKVLYFAGYKKLEDVFEPSSIEESSSTVVWCCDEKRIEPKRTQDKSYHGNIIDAIIQYNNHLSQDVDIPLYSIDRILIIGSSHMMDAVSHAIFNQLRTFFKKEIKVIASINSPMQCMMKEICAQCLQKHIDPITKQENFVYSCNNQDQYANYVDFNFLNERLKQNSLQEKCTKHWIDYCTHKLPSKT